MLYEVEVLQHAFVDGASSEATAYEKYGLLCGVEPKTKHCLLARDGCLDEVLAHGIARIDYLLGWEEAFHAVVCHTYLACLGSEVLVSHAGV